MRYIFTKQKFPNTSQCAYTISINSRSVFASNPYFQYEEEFSGTNPTNIYLFKASTKKTRKRYIIIYC